MLGRDGVASFHRPTAPSLHRTRRAEHRAQNQLQAQHGFVLIKAIFIVNANAILVPGCVFRRWDRPRRSTNMTCQPPHLSHTGKSTDSLPPLPSTPTAATPAACVIMGFGCAKHAPLHTHARAGRPAAISWIRFETRASRRRGEAARAGTRTSLTHIRTTQDTDVSIVYVERRGWIILNNNCAISLAGVPGRISLAWVCAKGGGGGEASVSDAAKSEIGLETCARCYWEICKFNMQPQTHSRWICGVPWKRISNTGTLELHAPRRVRRFFCRGGVSVLLRNINIAKTSELNLQCQHWTPDGYLLTLTIKIHSAQTAIPFRSNANWKH